MTSSAIDVGAPTDARAAIDAETAFVGTVAPEGADILDAAKLTAWMDANVEGFRGPVEVSKFKEIGRAHV